MRPGALEAAAAAGLRALPNWRGKTNVALVWKRLRYRRGRLDGRWCLRLSDGSAVCLPRGSQMTWSVAATGYWDRHLIALIARYIEPRTVALDIGASLGLWTLPLARIARANGSRLWCFEPNPENLPWLEANIERNDLGSVVELHAFALGSNQGTARLGYRESGGGNGALLDADAEDAVEVPVVRIDDLDFRQRVSFVKMDVEGFELEVLRGAHALIARDQPAIFGEFNSAWLRMRGEDLAAGLAAITGLGYEVFEVEERRSSSWRPKDVALLRPIEPGFVAGCENLLLLPRAKRGADGAMVGRTGRMDATPIGRPAIRRFPDADRRCGRSALSVAWRIAASLLRRRSPRLAVPVVEIGGARVHADLDTPLGLGLYRYGFCPPETRVLSKLLYPGDLFVDGGANIGLFSLIAAGLVGPTGRVLACEPGPGTMGLLKANVDENRFDTIELHEVALSDRPGRARFTTFEPGSGLASFAPEEAAGRQADIVVTVTTLDELTANIDRRVAVIKLDIEGAEAKALRGAHGLIGRDEPVFLIELEPEHLARQESSIADIRETLEPFGYEAYAITSAARLEKLTTDWRPPNARVPNVVLAPPSRSALLAGLMTLPATHQGSA